jgi:FtsP/CotA-like multicopper oxidase with cupredoxin domain
VVHTTWFAMKEAVMSKKLTRRRFVQYGAAGGAAMFVPWARTSVATAAAGGKLTKYVEPLPLPGAGIVVASASGSNRYAFTQRQIARRLHPQLPPTPLWAYDDGSGLAGQAGSFGMAVVAESGTPLRVTYTHDLPETYPSWIPVDTRLTPLGNRVRLMTHLHAGFVAGDSDGSPAVTPDGFGPGDTQTVTYTNQLPQMPASLLWFHDHGLGATRLNVFAGLAAALDLRARVARGDRAGRCFAHTRQPRACGGGGGVRVAGLEGRSAAARPAGQGRGRVRR